LGDRRRRRRSYLIKRSTPVDRRLYDRVVIKLRLVRPYTEPIIRPLITGSDGPGMPAAAAAAAGAVTYWLDRSLLI